MTTFNRDTPYGRKYATLLHLVYRITADGRLDWVGVYERRQDADDELACIKGSGDWKIADVACIGWGLHHGVVNRDRRISEMSDEEVRERVRALDAVDNEEQWGEWMPEDA
jgi:hypothetical protein